MSGVAPKSRILIVDDQRNMRTTTALVLRQEGYEVAEVESGEAALSRLLVEPFDLVLTDLKMAPLDGLAVLRGALEISPSTQVMVMTAYGTVESAVDAMQQGAYDYIAKPFSPRELVARVKAVLRRFERPLPPSPMKVGDIEIDPSAMTLTVRGSMVPTTAT